MTQVTHDSVTHDSGDSWICDTHDSGDSWIWPLNTTACRTDDAAWLWPLPDSPAELLARPLAAAHDRECEGQVQAGLSSRPPTGPCLTHLLNSWHAPWLLLMTVSARGRCRRA